MRHLFILNPAAGKKDITEKLSAIIKKLPLDAPYDIFVTDKQGAAEEETERYLRRYSDDFVRVYACGGDGTLSETANGIYRSGSQNCALGIIPVGSGNDFVKSLDVPREKLCDLKAQIIGDLVEVDLLAARDKSGKERVGLNIISAGFDAAVAKGQSKYKNLPFVSGSMAYNVSLVKCLFSNIKNYFTLLVDGEPFEQGNNGPFLFVIAANGKYYGGGYKASPYSDMSDGLLDFIRIDSVPKPRFLTLVKKFREGRHINEYRDIVSYAQCRKLQIVSEKMIDLNLDGEIFEMKNPIIEILPKAIKLIVPN